MNQIYLLIVLLAVSYLSLSGNICEAQSLLKTADGSSGILVGAQQNNDFAGINYNRGKDEFSLNYRFKNQQPLEFLAEPNRYPNFHGQNIELTFSTSKNKTQILADDKWQGGLGLSYTINYTFDNTKPSIKFKEKKKGKKYYSMPGGQTPYDSKEECERKEGKKCDTIETIITYYTLDNRRERSGYVKQYSLFLKIGDEVDRINTASLDLINADTTFIDFDNPLQNSLSLAMGVNTLHQINEKLFVSAALSFDLSFLSRSVSNLKKAKTQPLTATYLLQKDSSQVLQVGDVKDLHIGDAESEMIFASRLDLFVRYRLGDKTKPYLGLISSLNNRISSFNDLNTKLNYSVGPSISFPKLPDQILFALMFEWLENNKGNHDFGVTFHAGIPFSLD